MRLRKSPSSDHVPSRRHGRTCSQRTSRVQRSTNPIHLGSIPVRNKRTNKKDLAFGRVRDAFRPPPGASSVAYRSQSELPQCCGLCRSHTFTYAKNLLELPHLQTKSALPSRLHRRKLSTRLHPKCQLPTLLLAGESVRLGILLLHALRRPLILSISRQYT